MSKSPSLAYDIPGRVNTQKGKCGKREGCVQSPTGWRMQAVMSYLRLRRIWRKISLLIMDHSYFIIWEWSWSLIALILKSVPTSNSGDSSLPFTATEPETPEFRMSLWYSQHHPSAGLLTQKPWEEEGRSRVCSGHSAVAVCHALTTLAKTATPKGKQGLHRPQSMRESSRQMDAKLWGCRDPRYARKEFSPDGTALRTQTSVQDRLRNGTHLRDHSSTLHSIHIIAVTSGWRMGKALPTPPGFPSYWNFSPKFSTVFTVLLFSFNFMFVLVTPPNIFS